MAITLRDYIYLDESLVERLISQVEGGVSDEEERTDVEKIDKRRGAGMKVAPASAEIGRTTGKEVSASKTVRQTPDSACSRLIGVLEETDSLQFLDAFDEEIWRQIRRGEALEIEASIELSAVSQLGGIAEAFEPLVALMSSMGETVDADGIEAIKGFSKLSGLMKTIPVIAHPSGSPEYAFIASLKPEGMRLDQDQLSGEATVFGTLQRRLRDDETWTIFDAMGLAGLPRALRGEMEEQLSSTDTDELGGMVVKPPAAILNPIAVYR